MVVQFLYYYIMNISEITRRSGLSHTSAARHLEFLTKSGVLAEKRFNRVRIFRVDRSNPFVGVITKFLSEWQEAREASYRQPFN
jgi:DNA-binding IclR family transcriptional regulator